MMFFLIIAVVVLIIVAIWWYAHSQRAMMMSAHFRKMVTRSQAQEELLRLVADNQPEPIYILDDTTAPIVSPTKKAAEEAGMSPEDVHRENHLGDVRGAARVASQSANQLCGKVRSKAAPCFTTCSASRNPGKRRKIIRSAYVPLDHIPIPGLSNMPGVLVVEQDISEVIKEREQRLATQRQLVETLVKIVDMRDPFSANHSLLVSQIAYEIAVEMGLSHDMVETTRIAGSLMNIGKIVVPTALLTKTGALSEDEKSPSASRWTRRPTSLKDISVRWPGHRKRSANGRKNSTAAARSA